RPSRKDDRFTSFTRLDVQPTARLHPNITPVLGTCAEEQVDGAWLADRWGCVRAGGSHCSFGRGSGGGSREAGGAALLELAHQRDHVLGMSEIRDTLPH